MSLIKRSWSGSFQGAGVLSNATNVFFSPYFIELPTRVIQSATYIDFGTWAANSMVANTWYGVVANESTAALSIVPLGTGWTGYTISTNSINLMSIYNPIYGYCRAERTGVFYRLLSVFKTNSTPNGIMFTQNLYGRPKSGFNAYRGSAQSINSSTTTTIIYSTEEFDYNSEYDLSTGVFTAGAGLAGLGHPILCAITGVCNPESIANMTWTWDVFAVATNATSGLGRYKFACGASPNLNATIPAVKQFSLSHGDTVAIRVNHDRGSAQNTSATASQMYFSLMEI